MYSANLLLNHQTRFSSITVTSVSIQVKKKRYIFLFSPNCFLSNFLFNCLIQLFYPTVFILLFIQLFINCFYPTGFIQLFVSNFLSTVFYPTSIQLFFISNCFLSTVLSNFYPAVFIQLLYPLFYPRHEETLYFPLSLLYFPL